MKKILTVLISMILIIGLTACGTNEKHYIPKRAIIDTNGGYGMSYHVILFMMVSGGGYISYVSMDLYMDDLGSHRGDEILWKNYLGDDLAIEEGGENLTHVHVNVDAKTVNVTGYTLDGFRMINGNYKVETSSPDSWGIPTDRE